MVRAYAKRSIDCSVGKKKITKDQVLILRNQVNILKKHHTQNLHTNIYFAKKLKQEQTNQDRSKNTIEAVFS